MLYHESRNPLQLQFIPHHLPRPNMIDFMFSLLTFFTIFKTWHDRLNDVCIGILHLFEDLTHDRLNDVSIGILHLLKNFGYYNFLYDVFFVAVFTSGKSSILGLFCLFCCSPHLLERLALVTTVREVRTVLTSAFSLHVTTVS